MKTTSLFVINVLVFLLVMSCNVNPTKKAQNRIFSNEESVLYDSSALNLKRGYDYYEHSEEFLLQKMRNNWICEYLLRGILPAKSS